MNDKHDPDNIKLPFCPECETQFENETRYCPHDGAKIIIPAEDPMIGKDFDNRYKILYKIGQGGMGAVYKARQYSTGKIVAIKVISKSFTTNPETIKRFKREVRLQSMLEHPNIVTVIDFSETNEEEYYFVMGFVSGKSLKRMILEKGKMPLDLFFDLAIQMCNGMDYAHAKGIIHRDLKGENIIVVFYEHQQIIKILDFGIAKAIDETDATTTGLTKAGFVLGTPSYMSPEQARGEIKAVGPHSDIYSLGVIFFQMLTGILPFQSDTPWGMLHKHIYEAPPPIRKINSKIPKKLEKIIMHCLEKEIHKRCSSTLKLKEALLSIAPPMKRIKYSDESDYYQEDQTSFPSLKDKTFNKLLYLFLFLSLLTGSLFYWHHKSGRSYSSIFTFNQMPDKTQNLQQVKIKKQPESEIIKTDKSQITQKSDKNSITSFDQKPELPPPPHPIKPDWKKLPILFYLKL